MKAKLLITGLIFFALIYGSAYPQQLDNYTESLPDSVRPSFGALLGGTTIGGVNYQQLGFRADIPIGKLGIGVDLQFNIDQNGRIRKEDWDEWHDYLDKIYFVRWAFKGSPFYFKIGGLDYSYIGYENIVNGYTNMIEYPTVKRWGMEMSFAKKKFGGELLINDFKELLSDETSMLIGTRMYYNIIGKLALGATIAADLNEYNALKDLDKDGYPDEIDMYPGDKNWVTQYDYYLAQTNDPEYVEKSAKYGVIDSTRTSSLPKYGDSTSVSSVFGLDIGYPIINGDRIKLDVYSHFSKISNHGWGIGMPGIRLKIGNMLTIKAEYRKSSDEFLFGYYNQTYEIERAVFRKTAEGDKYVVTRQETLKELDKELDGFFVGMTFNIFGLVHVPANYQDLKGTDINRRSIRGEAALADNLSKKFPVKAKAYYYQNNVENFKEWKTPSTVMGYLLGYTVKGVNFGVDYRFTFQDMNADGVIRGKIETNKTIALRTSVVF